MKIAVIVPAHNEEAAIGPLVKAVKGLGYSAIVVDDGSQDQTDFLAGQAGAVVLKTQIKRSGKGTALKVGFDYTKARGYEALITMDGDGQHSPSDIPGFVACYEQTGADIVNGNRMLDPKGMPLVRLITNRVMSGLISLICRQRVPDSQCGFRMIRTKVLETINLESSDFEIETELLIKASKKGFKITSVGIKTIYSDEVSKIQPVRDTFRFIAYLWREITRRDDKT